METVADCAVGREFGVAEEVEEGDVDDGVEVKAAAAVDDEAAGWPEDEELLEEADADGDDDEDEEEEDEDDDDDEGAAVEDGTGAKS